MYYVNLASKSSSTMEALGTSLVVNDPLLHPAVISVEVMIVPRDVTIGTFTITPHQSPFSVSFVYRLESSVVRNFDVRSWIPETPTLIILTSGKDFKVNFKYNGGESQEKKMENEGRHQFDAFYNTFEHPKVRFH